MITNNEFYLFYITIHEIQLHKNYLDLEIFITFNQANESNLIHKTVRFRGGNSGVFEF